MTFELRRTNDDEFPRFARCFEDAFGFHADEANLADMRATTEIDRTIAVLDGDDVVGTAGAYTFGLTVPGGVVVPAAGVTMVTVRATHRRRGILRSMMASQLDDVAERGEPIAILTASEAVIYGRFGYGLATLGADWKIETDHAALRHPSRAEGGMRLVDKDEFAAHAPGVYDRRRQDIPGAVTRDDAWWEHWLKDREWTRGGQSERWYSLHQSPDGEVDGFLAYRRSRDHEHGLSRNVLTVDELFGLDDEVETALWAFAFEHDLIHTVAVHGRPVDDPIRWRLADPRRLVTTDVVDDLWLRIVDVSAALSVRHYGTSDRFTIEVVDGFRPDTSGRYLVDGGPTGAACSRIDEEPDLTMGIADLGAIYLGGTSPTALSRAGRIVEHTAGAVRRADTFFSSTPIPWMTTGF